VKARSFFLLVFLIMASLAVVNTQPVKSQFSGTIYIRSDGSVDPSNASIQVIGNLYTLTDNINGSIVVEKDNIVVNGAGYTLQGTRNGTGIDLSGVRNVTVQNFVIKQFFNGIYIRRGEYAESGNITVSGNNVANNDNGIQLVSSLNNIISGNNVTSNGNGILLISASNNNTVSGNNVKNNTRGIWLYDSAYNVLTNNRMHNNTYNFGAEGWMLQTFINYVDASNTVDGKPVYYWINARDVTVPSDAGYVALVNCIGVTVNNLTLTNNGQGVLLAFTENSVITENNIKNNYHGIYLCEASNNSIYHNNFIDNYYHVYDFVMEYIYMRASVNAWDNGYPSGGNYWSGFDVADEFKGPSQNEAGSDGIGDSPYVIYQNNQDNYPLVTPYEPYIPPPDTTPPIIFIISPQNKTYPLNHVSLIFNVSEQTSWIGYSLDGKAKVTIPGNITLANLSDGSHSIIVYAKDNALNTGASETIYFTIAQKTEPQPQPSEPFPITWIVAAVAIIAIVVVASVVYFAKVKKTTGKVEE